VVTLTGVAVGAASVDVSRSTFTSQNDVPATITENQTTELAVELVRATSAAGGSLSSRVGAPVVGGNGQTMTFQIELVIVGNDSAAITNLAAANFVLLPCAPDSNTPRTDCIGGVALDFDEAYQSTTPTAQDALLVPGLPREDYAAGLMLDQSQSINGSDPTGARLFSAKAFLDGLGPEDHVLLSAFANDSSTTALIPTKPLTIYPPFRDATTVDDAPSYDDTLDSLADLVGGGTHPGSGLPVIFDSARISSRLLLEDLGLPSEPLTSARPTQRPVVPQEKTGVFTTMASMFGLDSKTTP
jgi:hypothetical protein